MESTTTGHALRQREELLEKLFEFAPIGIAITDEAGRYLRVNPTFQRMLGYDDEELYQLTGWDITHEDDVELNAVLRRELYQHKRDEFTLQKRYRCKNGELRWVHNRVTLIRDPAGVARHTIALVEDITHRVLADAELKATASRLQALTRRLVDLQEIERRDISRELHDRVGQTLSAMRINVDMVRRRLAERDDPVIRERNEDSKDLIESTFKAVENLMYDLRPPMLDELGLVASLQWYAAKFTRRTRIEAEVRGREDWRCSPDIELALFRIAQEALSNVARHARAEHVTIEVAGTSAEVLMVIEDDGIGFDRAQRRTQASGYGLITMEERSEALKGTFQAAAGSGKGARITVRIPLPA